MTKIWTTWPSAFLLENQDCIQEMQLEVKVDRILNATKQQDILGQNLLVSYRR